MGGRWAKDPVAELMGKPSDYMLAQYLYELIKNYVINFAEGSNTQS